MSAATITTSVVTGGSNSHATVSTEANAYATDFVAQGVLGSFTNTNGVAPMTGSFGVNQDASPDMGITIIGTGNTTNTQSTAYVTTTPSSQDKQVLRARMSSDYTSYTINANASGATKYDWIYLQASATNAANPSLAADNVITLFTSRSTLNTSDNGSPPTYGVLLAVVTVANGASSITNANISDRRSQVTLNIGSTSNSNGWQTLNYPLTYASNAGDKSFTVTTPNDLRGVVSAGMKLSVARSVTPPSQCMSFTASSSQFASKSSPTGITFTAAYTAEAWIYLNSYPTAGQGIVSRYDGTNGWQLTISAIGQINSNYFGGGGNTAFQSAQSIPLNRWTHIALAVTSVSSKTALMYINGTAIATSSPASTATSLTQAGSLQVGATNSASPFDGYISEVRVWSVAQTAANIQANMTVNLVGNETNLVALYEGNGVFTDATSNANNLTASGGAIATQVANPYNIIEYGIISNIAFSTPTTTLTIFTGIDSNIPNQTLNNPQYSVAKEPFGFPGNLEANGMIMSYRPFLATSAANSTTASGGAAILGYTSTIKVPDFCHMIRATVFSPVSGNSTNVNQVQIHNGSISGITNLLAQFNFTTANGGFFMQQDISVIPGSSHTFLVGVTVTGGSMTVGGANSFAPAYYKLEAV